MIGKTKKEYDLIDNFGELDFGMDNDDRKEMDNICPIHLTEWNIVNAFNVINDNAPRSRLNKELFVVCAEAFSYLSQTLGLNAIQSIVLAMLIEEGKKMSYRQMGNKLGLSRLSMMTYYEDLEALFKRRWLQHCGAREPDGVFDGYMLARGVVSAVRENRPFEPEILECADTQEFVEKVAYYVACDYNNEELVFNDQIFWIQEIVNANKELPICKLALDLKDSAAMTLLILVVADYCNFPDNGGLGFHEVRMAYSSTSNLDRQIKMFRDGTHQLFALNLIEHAFENGMADTNRYVATSYLKEEVLADFENVNQYIKKIPKMNGYKSHKDILPNSLFYNEEERTQVERLGNILSQNQFPLIQKRLRSKGMRAGVCVLMHGVPGTGKTATVFELARKTGRDIIQVQVTDFMNKYVGESETRLKNVFNNYSQLCEGCETTPILLLNEGDAILSRRIEKVEHSTEQMMNSLQNILLEEMENLQGIMIVTTNLANNLDKAFERRFIFKIRFEKPSVEVKALIWQFMIDKLDEKCACELARMYDFTGGEIENISRKITMEYVLTGKTMDQNMIKEFARQEKMESGEKNVIGFFSNVQS